MYAGIYIERCGSAMNRRPFLAARDDADLEPGAGSRCPGDQVTVAHTLGRPVLFQSLINTVARLKQ